MTTIQDVAKRAGVSTATVSHVANGTRFVSDPVRERVQTAMTDLGYRPNRLARSLRKGQTHTIGLLLPDSGNPFYAELARGIEEAAYAQGYSVILCNTDNDPAKESAYINLLVEKQVDGIILDPEERKIDQLLAKLPEDLPIVTVDRDYPDNALEVVLVDNCSGARLATSHLIGLHHKRIACLTGNMQLLSGVDRLSGFRQAMAEVGLPVEEELIYYGDFRAKSGYEGGLSLLNREDRPTAIFSCNDMMAVGLMRAAYEIGLSIPKDLSVIGFDNLEIDQYLYPPLTSISHRKAKIGEKAIEILKERIQGHKHLSARFLIPPLLIERQSTTPPKELALKAS